MMDAAQTSDPSAAAKSGGKKTRARQTQDAAWSLEPHVCRHCFGRLASRDVGDGHRVYQCTNCGAEGAGSAADVLCACGLKLTPRGLGKGPVDAGIRCHANPAPTPEFPSLFVASEVKT